MQLFTRHYVASSSGSTPEPQSDNKPSLGDAQARLTARVFVVLLPVLSWAHLSSAQEVRVISLRRLERFVDSAFLSITSVRELDDGSVILSDPRDGRLVLIDRQSRSIQTIGRSGRGPGEYPAAFPVRPLRGDSSIMIDPASRRWLYLVGGRIAGVEPADARVIVATRGRAMGVDSLGNVLAYRDSPLGYGVTRIGPHDSTVVLIVDRASGRQQEVVSLRRAPVTLTRSRQGRGASLQGVMPPFSTGEEVLLFPDGWLAVARLEPYRIEWRKPDGSWVQGAPIPYKKVPVDAAEKALWLANAKANGVSLPVPSADLDWPEYVPPFAPLPLVATSDGLLLVLRLETSRDSERRYDLVGRDGRLSASVELSRSVRIVGFGKNSVYLERRDDDGFRWLLRHAWPVSQQR